MDFLIDNIILVVVATVSGGLLLVPNLLKSGGALALGVTRVAQLVNHEHGVLVDIRDEEVFKQSHIAGSRHIPVDDLAQKLAKFNKSKPIILVAQTDKLAQRSLVALKKQEFEAVYFLGGGVAAWQTAGLPLVSKKGEK